MKELGRKWGERICGFFVVGEGQSHRGKIPIS
jgi:hypothetical protein